MNHIFDEMALVVAAAMLLAMRTIGRTPEP
jgi:hypothetical protein